MSTATRVEFKGSGGDFFVFLLVRCLLMVVTFGIYGLFLGFAVRNWKYHNTRFEGQEMQYRASLGDWLVHVLVSMVLMILTGGLYTPWAIARNKRYAMEHSYLADGRRFTFNGSGGEVIGLTLLTVVLIPLTLGLAFPWMYAMWKKWEWSHTCLSVASADVRSRGSVATTEVGSSGWIQLGFNGDGSTAGGLFIVSAVLSFVTLGLYSAWASVNLMRWEAENIELLTPAAQSLAAVS